MSQLENVFLKDRNYLAGDDISIADIMAICEVMAPYASGYDIFQGRPKVAAWAERVQQQLNPHFDDIHINGPLGRVFAKFNPSAKM
jgi:glutathione S-transferase